MSLDIGAALSTLRHRKNLSQREAARDLGISQALLSHYENGAREPRMEFIVRACDYYGVSADYLAGRTAATVNPLVGSEDIWSDGEFLLLITAFAELSAVVRSELGTETQKSAERYLTAALCRLLLDMGGDTPALDTDAALALFRAQMALAEAELRTQKPAVSFPGEGKISELLQKSGERLARYIKSNGKRSDT